MLELAKLPPTDNLYKFLALTGLGVLLFSIVWPELQNNEITGQGLELQKEIRVWMSEVQDEAVKQNLITKEEIAEIEKKGAAGSGVSLREYIAIRTERVAEIEQGLIKRNLPETQNLRKKAIEIKFLLERLSYKLDKKTFYDNVFIYGQLIGLVLTVVGFALWYLKLQRYQDVMIAKPTKE